MSKYRFGLVVLAASCAFGARAEMPLGPVEGDYEVTVANGATETWSSPVSISGNLVKKGGGVLVLSAANTFGGIVLEAGRIDANESGCLGSGPIEIKGQTAGYTGPCEIRFTACGKDYGSPSIHVTGDTTLAYPALSFVSATNVFSGTIVADHNLYFKEDSQWLYDWYKAKKGSAKWSTDVNQNRIMTFNGDISAAGIFHLLPDGRYTFNGDITADTFETVCVAGEGRHDTNDTFFYATMTFTGDCTFNKISYGYRNLEFTGSLAPGLLHTTNKLRPGEIDIRSDCRTAGIDVGMQLTEPSDIKNRCNLVPTGTGTYTLTLTGTAANATCTSYLKLDTGKNSDLNFELNAAENPGFVQELAFRTNTMAGFVKVTSGTLRLTKGAVFPSVSEVSVGSDGVLEVDANAGIVPFPRPFTLDVAGTATFAAGTERFADKAVTLKLYDGSQLDLSGKTDWTVGKLFYNGRSIPVGRWTRNDIPVLPEGLTLTVTASEPQENKAVTWTSAAGDKEMSTLGNWVEADGETVPTSLDFTFGAVAATVAAAGDEMRPSADCTRISSLVFERDAATCGPFTLGGAGRRLEVDGQVLDAKQSQIVLRGTLSSPFGRAQGDPEEKGAHTFTYLANSLKKDTAAEGSIFSPYTSDRGTPLILDNVTVDKPAWTHAGATGGEQFYALPATTNVFLQAYRGGGGGWNVMNAGAGTLVEFRGGAKQYNRLVLPSAHAGTIRVTGKPLSAGSGVNIEGGTLVLDAEGCELLATAPQNYGLRMGSSSAGRLEFLRSGCLKDNNKEQLDLQGSKQITVDFHQTTQRVSRIAAVNTHKSSVLTGEYPAMLEVKGGTKWTGNAANTVLTNMIQSVQVTGGLGFHYLGNGPAQAEGIPAGSADTFVLTGKAFESCGDLEVDAGTLELASNASWLNGTNFVARGTGTLKFGGSHQVDKRFAVLTIDGEGKVEIAPGKTLAVAECRVGDVKVEDGVYSAANLPAGCPLYGHLTGGVLRVGRVGAVMIVR